MKIEARELPTYDGLTEVDEFLSKFKSVVLEKQWFDALKWALHATPARWWGTHQENFETGADVVGGCAHVLEAPSLERELGI